MQLGFQIRRGNTNVGGFDAWSASVAVMTIASIALMAACGSVEFKRAAGVKKFRALPMGSPVTAQDSIDGLTTPVLVVGVLNLETKTKVKEPDLDNAIVKLRRHAATYGCDAVVGASSTAKKKVFKKKVKSLGQDGRPVFKITETTVWTHVWTAQCVRTAKAPKEVVLKRDKYGRLRAAKAGAAAGNAKPAASATKPTAAAPSPSSSSSKTPTPAAARLPPADAGDPKLASEVARAFLTFSRYAASANAPMICKMLDSERIYFDVRTKQPSHAFKKDMTPKAACASLKTGKLAAYLQDFGPAEVHTEIPTLIPSLFRVHGGAYLKLDTARDKLYRTKLTESRKGKTPLQCEMYSVLPAGNLFKVMLDCRGVRSYRLLLRRDGPNDFKLMALTHLR